MLLPPSQLAPSYTEIFSLNFRSLILTFKFLFPPEDKLRVEKLQHQLKLIIPLLLCTELSFSQVSLSFKMAALANIWTTKMLLFFVWNLNFLRAISSCPPNSRQVHAVKNITQSERKLPGFVKMCVGNFISRISQNKIKLANFLWGKLKKVGIFQHSTVSTMKFRMSFRKEWT